MLALMVLILALVASARPAMRLAAARLVLDHGPGGEDCEVIIVLAGGEGQRVDEGVRLWREGRSTKGLILFAGGPIFRGITWAEVMGDYARELGVPDQAMILETRSRTTQQDADQTVEILRKRGLRSAVLVTDAYHSARAFDEFRRAAPEIRWRSRPVPAPDGDWWKDASQARFVVSEYLKRLWPGP